MAMHGLYHTEYHEDFRTIYETPAVSADPIRTYDIDYIEVSSWERASYAVDENYFRSAWPCIFDNGEIQIYRDQSIISHLEVARPSASLLDALPKFWIRPISCPDISTVNNEYPIRLTGM